MVIQTKPKSASSTLFKILSTKQSKNKLSDTQTNQSISTLPNNLNLVWCFNSIDKNEQTMFNIAFAIEQNQR